MFALSSVPLPNHQIVLSQPPQTHGECSKGSCKERTIGNALFQDGNLTKQGTCIVVAVLGTGILNNYHMSPLQDDADVKTTDITL